MSNTEYIPIAALNQYAYCPHRYWRMFCAGEFTDNQYTIEGTSLHSRVHTLGEGFSFEARRRRPPTDPVNSLLSLGYSLLRHDVQSAVNIVGFDPYLCLKMICFYRFAQLNLEN